MTSGPNRGPGRDLHPEDRDRLAAIRAAGSLAELRRLTGAGSEHEAYFAAKSEWAELRGAELAAVERPDVSDDVPGNAVEVDGTTFHVHGVTHADTTAERDYLREHASRYLSGGATVYCEQGIRSMYFDDLDGVCGMDDYSWAMQRCEALGLDSHVGELSSPTFDGFVEGVDSLAAEFRDAVFSLIDSGIDVYGDAFGEALGDVASTFLVSHEGMATGADFESFQRTHDAATDPEKLVDLQRYYERAFLPQPLEREWLRRHDRELELVTHARNERMADYAVYHNEAVDAVHLIVGAAHLPGVTYELERHREGRRDITEFELYG